MNIDLMVGNTRLTLYTNRYSKSVSDLENRQYSSIFKEKASTGKQMLEFNTLNSDKIKMVTFFELSDSHFVPTLIHLEEITEKLVSI